MKKCMQKYFSCWMTKNISPMELMQKKRSNENKLTRESSDCALRVRLTGRALVPYSFKGKPSLPSIFLAFLSVFFFVTPCTLLYIRLWHLYSEYIDYQSIRESSWFEFQRSSYTKSISSRYIAYVRLYVTSHACIQEYRTFLAVSETLFLLLWMWMNWGRQFPFATSR